MGMGSSFGGDLGDWWDYDMATDTWTEKPSIPAPERHHPYQFGIDGIIYTGFGHNGPEIYNTWYAYDPSDESWEELASCRPRPCGRHAVRPRRAGLRLERRRRVALFHGPG